MDTTAAKTKASASEEKLHAPLSVELHLGQRVHTAEGFATIVGFPTYEESIGFGRVRTFTKVRVKFDNGVLCPMRADEISVVKDG